jgi:four helix bundle protein
LNRASPSIAASIAEGNGRFTKPDRKNFFGIARGSVQECVPLLELALRRKLLVPKEHESLKSQLEEIARMLSVLINGPENRESGRGTKNGFQRGRLFTQILVRSKLNRSIHQPGRYDPALSIAISDRIEDMDKIVEQVDILRGSTEHRLSLLLRESVRRSQDRTLKTRILELIDATFGLGYWWFRTFDYECQNPDGTLWKRHQVRRTLAGYVIAWGRYSEYYDDGKVQYEGISRLSLMTGRVKFRRHHYWLPDGSRVSQLEWMQYMFGPEIEGCCDPAWEK